MTPEAWQVATTRVLHHHRNLGESLGITTMTIDNMSFMAVIIPSHRSLLFGFGVAFSRMAYTSVPIILHPTFCVNIVDVAMFQQLLLFSLSMGIWELQKPRPSLCLQNQCEFILPPENS
jgi:hypothetical protein